MAEIKNQYREISRENQEYKAINAQLTLKVSSLETKVRDLEQYSRQDNIEISGLPKTAGREDERSILRDVGRAIGLEVNENTVVAVHRVPTYSRTRVHTPHRGQVHHQRPERRLDTSLQKEKDGYGLIYIGEHLTPDNKQLLRKLKDACKELNIKYVWCREGKFYVRRTEGATSERNAGDPAQLSSFTLLNEIVTIFGSSSSSRQPQEPRDHSGLAAGHLFFLHRKLPGDGRSLPESS
ncbi:uncharacterized protein LOC124373944 [Homalodisca vitripennis]|uniref:uncharacterized protein LOC124373944 n=1 Tax=Homalodisca vitripennis TaxID=197043 RepID=UPI001EEAD998|nr:uncharacterized protein LOC124373944 [Homalodisca vitripennis]